MRLLTGPACGIMAYFSISVMELLCREYCIAVPSTPVTIELPSVDSYFLPLDEVEYLGTFTCYLCAVL